MTQPTDEPTAIDSTDTGNTDIDLLVGPLDPDDDVFALINPSTGTVPVVTGDDGD